MAEIDGPIVVRARDGMQQPLGRFLGDLAKQTGRPVTEIAREAQISRAYYYVLRDSDQTPSIETLANLLTSLGVDFRLGDRADDAEFVVRTEGEQWLVRLPYEGKKAARARAVRDMTYESRLPNKPPPPELEPVGPGEPLYALAPLPASVPSVSASGAGRTGRTFVVGRGTPRRNQSAREGRLLSELVSAAGELDADRLEHLIATAKLLADRDT